MVRLLIFPLRGLPVFPAVLLAALAALAGGCAFADPPGTIALAGDEDKNVIVSTHREGGETRFYVENRELCEVTVTFEMQLSGLIANTTFPCTATFSAGKTTEAFVLRPEREGGKWNYAYTNYYKLGSNRAQHDDQYAYRLPYAPGSAHNVTQAFGGKYSHRGSNLYAIDWQMAEGTPVYAARGGLVVKTRDSSNRGGPSMDFDKYNNYVLIQHPDGTLGHYCHLQQGGALVKPGQMVTAGALIGRSGNTGFSSGPHLHFCVFMNRSGRERVSLPIRFQTMEDGAATLTTGQSYRATTAQTARVEPPATLNEARGAAGPVAP